MGRGGERVGGWRWVRGEKPGVWKKEQRRSAVHLLLCHFKVIFHSVEKYIISHAVNGFCFSGGLHATLTGCTAKQRPDCGTFDREGRK